MVFALKNATAEDVARIVTQFVDTDQKKVVQTLGTGQVGSASRLLEREVTIVGDKKTNSVLVTASPRYLETLQTVIRELDVDPPQVLIQVVLAEVTLGNTEELGVEFTRFRVGSVNVAGGFGLNRGNFVNGAPRCRASSDWRRPSSAGRASPTSPSAVRTSTCSSTRSRARTASSSSRIPA